MPVAVPPKVKVEINGQQVSVEGPKGKLEFRLPSRTTAKLDGTNVLVSRAGEDAEAKSLHGLSRALIQNMVKGVSEGFVKKLEIQGVGFKAAVLGDKVNLVLGYSHPINYLIPRQIKVTVEENTKLTIEGPDKQMVGQVASETPQLLSAGTLQGQGRALCGREGRPQGRQDRSIIYRRRQNPPLQAMRSDKKRRLAALRHFRIRQKVNGTKQRPRMSVRFTNQNIYVQFIDDGAGTTLASASTLHQTAPDRGQPGGQRRQREKDRRDGGASRQEQRDHQRRF